MKPIPDDEFRGWLQDLDDAFGIFLGDFSPCPCTDVAELLTASIEWAVAKRQPMLDAIADAEKRKSPATEWLLTYVIGRV
jgi:hypothetical protein